MLVPLMLAHLIKHVGPLDHNEVGAVRLSRRVDNLDIGIFLLFILQNRDAVVSGLVAWVTKELQAFEAPKRLQLDQLAVLVAPLRNVQLFLLHFLRDLLLKLQCPLRPFEAALQ